MRIQGHRADDPRHGTGWDSAGRQQYRVRDTAKKKHGRHILPVNAHAEMQAGLGAVTGLERSDQFSARHRVAY
jgi:hypothetical protein